jgi:hypothetical protein
VDRRYPLGKQQLIQWEDDSIPALFCRPWLMRAIHMYLAAATLTAASKDDAICDAGGSCGATAGKRGPGEHAAEMLLYVGDECGWTRPGKETFISPLRSKKRYGVWLALDLEWLKIENRNLPILNLGLIVRA